MTDKSEENKEFNTFEQDTDESKFETEYLSQELEQTSAFEENTDASHVSSSAMGNSSGVLVNGQLLQSLGEYDLIEELGKGGMGQVFKARHRTMKREVALKVLAPRLVGSPDAINRFHREVEAAAKLSHANIVTAHDASEYQGVHYLVSELVRGKDFEEVIKANGPLPVEEAVDYITQAAKGLEYAHSQSVIHRDIKPANLLLDEDRTVKILDMGLARIESEEQDLNLTASGAVMGTAPYMPPEQGMNTKNADHRSDIYSLGYTLYFMLKAKMPYRGESVMEILVAHREQPIPDIESIPKSLKRIYKKMTAKKPEDRYQSMSDVITALENLKLSKQSAGNQNESKSPVPLIAIGSVVLVVLLLGLFFSGVFLKNQQDAITPTPSGSSDDGLQLNNSSYEIGSIEHERAAAEWVIENKGQVFGVQNSGQVGYLNYPDLKSQDFQITKIKISGTEENDFQILAGLIKLKVLQIQKAPIKNISDILPLPELEELNLNTTLVNDDGFSSIPKFENLINLSIRNAKLSEKSLGLLASLPKLEYLDFSSVNDNGAGIQSLLNIPNLAVASMPFEVFAEIGLELKQRSPIQPLMNISIANGSHGYLPTPEQHRLGGYETWIGVNKVQLDASEKMIDVLVEMLGELNTTSR